MYGGNENSSDIVNILKFLGLSIVLFAIFWLIIRYVVGGLLKPRGYGGSSKVVLVNKPHVGNKTIHIEQNPYGTNKNKFIKKSDNEDLGIEFTYSMWVFLDGYDVSSSHPKLLFYKGSNVFQQDKQLPIIYCPLIFLDGNTNVLHVLINTYSNPSKGVSIPDIPINKWLSIVVAVNQINMDVYINGNLSKSLKLESLPRQNNGDVYINSGRGFDGYISKVTYYNKYLSFTDINDIVNDGPGEVNNTMFRQEPRYLSNSFWY